MSEKDVNEGRGSFSWKTEADEALGSYVEKGKDRKSYASSIFSSQNSTDFTSPMQGGYKYDFPKDGGYIYSPSAHTSSSQSKSAIFSDRTEKAAPAQRSAEQRRPERKATQERAKKKNAPASKKTHTKNESKFSFISGLGRGSASSTEKASAQGRRPSQKRPPQDRRREGERRPQGGRSEENALKRRQEQSRQYREQERERREDERRDRNNTRFDDSRKKGISADESRRAHMKKKKSNMKFYGIICALVLIVGALGAVFAYGILEGAPIATIIVEGNETYKKKDILAAAGITTGDNMLLVREKKTNSIISTSLPYVDSVEVKYEFPDTLKLNIAETADKIHVMMGKNMLTLDEKGKVLSNKKKKIAKGNYKIIGLEKQDYNIGYAFEADKDNGNDEKYALAFEIIEALSKVGITGFRDISFEDMKCITISTVDGISLYINEKTPLERQLGLAKDAIAEKMASKSRGYFDLRFDEMVVHN